MARTLDVYLDHHLTGHLTQDDSSEMSFEYAQSWLNYGTAVPLSQSLPLRKERFSRKECAGFFGGILPESDQRKMVAKNLGISERNDFAMLERIGGECAGAVTFMPSGQPLPDREDRYRNLTAKELADVVKSLPRRPLLAGEEGVRLSLAGAQDKVAVKVSDDTISIPLGGAPSTHILKPENPNFGDLVFNESLCLDLARAVGLLVPKAEIRSADGLNFLLVERYDRSASDESSGHYDRLHQEDFCQALGIVSDRKYQSEGGPSLEQCFGLLREVSTTPVIDLQRLLDAVIFNYLIGNNDAHGKNFSIVYNLPAAEAKLAPLYDLVCTVHYPDLSNTMAMKIGGEYLAEKVSPRHFEKLAEEADLAKPLVKRRVLELATAVIESLGKIDAKGAPDIATTIEKRSRAALDRFAG